MTLTPVESLPKRVQQDRNALEKMLKEFVSSGMRIARIDYHSDEYKDPGTLYTGVWYAIERLDLSVRVCMRNHQVYLIKT